MRPFAFWSRPIPVCSTRAIFNEGLAMAFPLSLGWLIFSASYLMATEPQNLSTLLIIFFGTTFFAVPACTVGGFTGILLLGIHRYFRPQNPTMAVSAGIAVAMTVSILGIIVFQSGTLKADMLEAVAATLYMAFAGRLSAKIFESLQQTKP